MDLAEVLSLHEVGRRPVFVQPQASPHTARLPGAEPARPEMPQDAVVVDFARAGDEVETLERTAAVLNGTRVGVVLLATGPASLPVGRVLSALGQAGLRVLALHSMDNPTGGAALVVTRDETAPLRSHVLGQAFTTSSADAARRRDNEYLVETVLARARLADTERRLDEAQREHEQLAGELLRGRDRVRALEEELTRLRRDLAMAEKRSPRALARRLAARSRRAAVDAGHRVAGRVARER